MPCPPHVEFKYYPVKWSKSLRQWNNAYWKCRACGITTPYHQCYTAGWEDTGARDGDGNVIRKCQAGCGYKKADVSTHHPRLNEGPADSTYNTWLAATIKVPLSEPDKRDSRVSPKRMWSFDQVPQCTHRSTCHAYIPFRPHPWS